MATPSLTDFPDRMTVGEFWDLVGKLEHEQLEFKRGVPDDIRTTIPAMAMTDGGVIALGVKDDRTITGCPLSQNTLDRISRYSHEVGVEVQVREIAVGSVKVTLVAVPEVRGRIVTTADGRLVRRVGGDCQPLVGDALARFVRERENRSSEEEMLPQFDVGAIDLKMLNHALSQDGRPAVRRDAATRALMDLGLATPAEPPAGVGFMKAAAILFARDPTPYVPGATVQLVRRVGVGPGPGPSSAREEVSGPLPAILDRCLRFVDAHTRRFHAVVGTHREVLSEYPREVLREALLNALGHRDYGLEGATVDVTIWDDRIEIRSPGGLPGHITIDNMRHEHYSRNRRIMRVLKTMGLVEEYGEGVDRMIREMESRLMKPPVFAATPASVTVTIRNRFLVAVEDQVWLALLSHVDLSPGERRALVAARRDGFVTPRDLRLLMPGADIDELLAAAVAKGLLVRVGQRGGTRYVLSDEVVIRAGSTGLEAQSRKRQMLLDEVRRRGSLSTAEAAQVLGGEDTSFVRHLLNDLVRAGQVRASGNTRARRYYSV